MRAISSAGRGDGQDFFGEVLQRVLTLHPGGVPGSSGAIKEDPRMARKSNPKKKLSKAASKETALVPKGYEEFLGKLKERIRTAQLRGLRSRSTGS